jgi:hypothetical protein
MVPMEYDFFVYA